MHGAKTLLGDGDTGWHVRTGEWILSHGRVPDKDLFSFTKTGQTWFAWEWLWDVIFAWLHQHWGMAAVVVASALVIALTSALVFRLTFRKSGNPLIAMAFTFLAVASSSIHFLAQAAPGHAAVRGGVLYDFGAGAGSGESAAVVVASGFDGAVDKSAWRVVYRGGPDGSVWRGRAGGRVVRWGAGGMAGGGETHAALCGYRFAVPGSQPGRALHLSPARAYLGVPDGLVPARAYSGNDAHQFPESGGALPRGAAAGGRAGRASGICAASVSRSACCWCSSRTWR